MITGEEIVATLQERMAARRAQFGWTLQEVADAAGLSKSWVWEVENGKQRSPTIETVVRLSTALGVSVDYLIGVNNSQPNLHPDAMRLACEIDRILRRAGA